jgi:HSP20 family molecular chaperone IbpA
MPTEVAVNKTPETEVSPREYTRSGFVFRPNVDILESAEELTLHADLPGADKDAIDVDFENGTLTLHARVAARQPENTAYLVREYGLGDYYRVFQVSESIDGSRISAEFRDGVLILHLPKVEAVKPRKIPVKV